MQLVIMNSPIPVVRRRILAALIVFLAAFHFTSPVLNAQALNQLYGSASATETPLPPAPGDAAVYTAAPGFNIYFLSVGQGDSIYIELPNGQNALIDGGPSNSASGPLAQFLTQKNVVKIDHVVLTHPHSDHYNGLQYVFSNITVGSFYDTRMDNSGASTDDKLRGQIAALGVNTVYPAPGDELSWGAGGVKAKVFNSCPEAVASSIGNQVNDCSIVIKLSYQGASALFVGDAQADVEARMVSAYGAELKADVLKVGHHGSQYSSSEPFLSAVKPARAYIEVGKNNYGHPTQGAISRLLAAGAKVFRTDLDGTQEYSPALALLAAAGSSASAY
ncbi:MAG: MBL fold metallo-hydrolase [Elusimicrobia bacterium]|nr:MBL fold metallo-hydrolase [Elusimicrobiota bacterium]